MDRLLTTNAAAAAASVGPSAIKRWADAGLLPCVKTAGGHRRFRESDVVAFLARQGAARAVDGAPTGDVAGWLDALLAADSGHEVEASLLTLRARSGSWHGAAAFVAAALVELGERWARGDVSVIDEHLASERLLATLMRLAESVPVAPDAPVVLLTSVDGDEHLLGLALVLLCCREAGLRTRWPGRATPRAEVVRFLQRGGTAILAVSASVTSGGADALRAWLDPVIEACRASDVELWLGGEGAWPEELPFGRRLRSFDDLHAALEQRRGR